MFNIIGTTIVLSFIAGAKVLFFPHHKAPPVINETYWGPGSPPTEVDESIRPFKISFGEDMINDLRYRLNNTRTLQPPLENSAWTYGVNTAYLPTVLDYWLNKYDFKAREDHLNKYPQFITNIQGLDIHFYHIVPQVADYEKVEIIPLYIQHGWSGSIVEFQKLFPLLIAARENYDFVFEVIAPSIPGIAYSDAAAKIGLGAPEMAVVLKNLMLRLGHEKFYVQGGDWGTFITTYLAALFPEHVLGVHSNVCLSFEIYSILKWVLYDIAPNLVPQFERERTYPFLTKFLPYALQETGYFHYQSSKPDTLGVGLTDSPAGLATYLIEKIAGFTKHTNIYAENGNLNEKFTMDEIIDDIMMYWAPNKATSSMRIYAETVNKKFLKYMLDDVAIKPPSACAQYPNEILSMPKSVVKDRFVNLVHFAHMPRGGHYAAFEEPHLFADNLFEAVKAMREYHKKHQQ